MRKNRINPGDMYGDWIVLNKSIRRRYWVCKCVCGEVKEVYEQNLKLGKSKSCGKCGVRRDDISGNVFGRLTVIKLAFTRKGHTYYLCKCSCGNEKIIERSGLTSGNVNSCGCLKNERVSAIFLKDLTGLRFGRLTVIKRDTDQILPSKKTCVRWLCKCDCGKYTSINSSSLLHAGTQSCGCLTVEKSKERIEELSGKRFGNLTVIDYAGNSKWNCLCDCGNICVVSTGNLNSSGVRSCGCIAESKYETWCKELLHRTKYNFVQHISFDDLLGYGDGKLSYDFAIYYHDKLIFLIECQGQQHYHPIDFFGGEEQFAKQQLHDELKREYAKSIGIPLLEIPYTLDSYEKIENFLKENGITTESVAQKPF